MNGPTPFHAAPAEMNLAALYVRRDSNYKALGLNCYDEDRDARTFPGGSPVIAHPPCRSWGRLAHFAKPRDGERDLAFHAVVCVRACGGVLEHPESSRLWAESTLPRPGSGFDDFGGWTLPIDQFWFGHRARKRTLLYIVGVRPQEVPPFPLVFGHPATTVERMGRAEREHTPAALCTWLVQLAARVRK